MIRQAKDPINDKYDTYLIFLIKIIGPSIPKVQVYVDGEYHRTLKIDMPKKVRIDFDKIRPTLKFPPYLTIKERKRWRQIHAKVERGATTIESDLEFYKKWKPLVGEASGLAL
jgi:hypothetical protein